MINEARDLIESSGKQGFHCTRYEEFEFEPVRVDSVVTEGNIRLANIAFTPRLRNFHRRPRASIRTFIDDKVNTVVCPNRRSMNSAYSVARRVAVQAAQGTTAVSGLPDQRICDH
jgi:hypothetical protein